MTASMDAEAAEGSETSTNGVSTAAAANHYADARAAFLAGEAGDADESPKASEKAEKPSTSVEDEDKGDDSDLDDENEDRDEVDADESADDDEDEDKDLDEDDDEGKDADKGEKPDADTARRIDQVRRTDKRLREQRDRDFAARDAEFDTRVKAIEKEWAPRIEAAERFERLAARASIDPVAVLHALGVDEDRYEHTAQVLYTLAKAKDDPKAKAAAAALMKERERDDEIADLKKWREEREKADKDREQKTAADRQVDSFIDSITKAASEKTPLAKALLKNDPDSARDELQIVAYKLAQESGVLPDAKKVMIAFEKHQRAKLRKLGIDPKSRGAAAALTDPKTDAQATPKKVDKKADKTSTAKTDDGKKRSPKEEFILLNGKYD